jgi:flagellar biosynthesis anti-sigma factor FlgM
LKDRKSPVFIVSAFRLKSLLGNADSIETGEVEMKIEVTAPATSHVPDQRSARQVSNTNSSAASNQGATEDRTTFYSDSASVQSLVSQALTSPEFRQDKVDAVRQSISNGQYQADPTKIAAGIIASNQK